MWEGPIVAEVHRIREQLAAKYDFDITAFFADLRRRQAALGDRLVLQKQRAEPTAEADQDRDSTGGEADPKEARRPRPLSLLFSERSSERLGMEGFPCD